MRESSLAVIVFFFNHNHCICLLLVKPGIDHTCEDDTKLEGEELVLSAIVSGIPIPAVRWEKNDQTVMPGMGVLGKSVDHTHSLILPSLTFDDSGTYKVKASNILGEDSRSINVTVKGDCWYPHISHF